MKTIDNIKIKKCVTLLVLMLFFLAESFSQFVNTYKDDEGRIAHTTLTVAGLAVEQGGQIVIFGFYSMNDTDYHYFAENIGAITLSKDLKTLLITLLNPSATYKFYFVESTSVGGLNNQTPNTYQNPTSSSSSSNRTVCSYCNGTGRVESSIAGYGITDEKWCDFCKKWVPYTHCCQCKICPSCGGKGYK